MKELRAARRSCRDNRERKQLSKKISNEMRRVPRQWQSQKLQSTLEKFSDLKKLSRICSAPVQRSCTIRPDDASLASVLNDVYSDSPDIITHDGSAMQHIPPFDMDELSLTFKRMSNGTVRHFAIN